MKKSSCQLSVVSCQKINIVLLFTFYFLLFTFAGCAKKEIKNINSKGKNIICFGDSITFGYGVNPGEDYPTALSKIISIPVINAGIDGDTTTEALKRMDADVLKREPLMAIIEFGGNDFLRKVPNEVTLNNLRAMIDRIQAKGAMVAVVDISAGILLKEYHTAFYELAQEKGAIFIPNILSGIITNPRLKSDYLHPNGDGYKVIAQRVYRTILPYLNQNTLAKKFK